MDSDNFIQYGKASKPYELLSSTEQEQAQIRIQNKVRQQAWAVGSPVYYGVNGLIIAEYENGKKMVVEKVNDELVETREYEE